MNDSQKKNRSCWEKWRRSGAVLPNTTPTPSSVALVSGADIFLWSLHVGRKGQLITLKEYWDDPVSCSGIVQGSVRIAVLARVMQEHARCSKKKSIEKNITFKFPFSISNRKRLSQG